jgi:hypothetical protein
VGEQYRTFSFRIISNQLIVFLSLSREGTVGIATSYWLDDQGVGLPSPGGVKNFLHVVHPTSYPMCTGASRG